MENAIKEISKNATIPLLNVSQFGAKQIKEFNFDCQLLKDYNNEDIRFSESYKSLFEDLATLTGPCLYYFTVNSQHSPDQIIEAVREYRDMHGSKAVPAIKTKIPQSNTLYVGKVKRHFYGRVIQHLGFFPVNRTQGLQLYYWTRKLPLNLKLTVLEFEPEMIDLMEVLENGLARHLNPILGKHK